MSKKRINKKYIKSDKVTPKHKYSLNNQTKIGKMLFITEVPSEPTTEDDLSYEEDKYEQLARYYKEDAHESYVQYMYDKYGINLIRHSDGTYEQVDDFDFDKASFINRSNRPDLFILNEKDLDKFRSRYSGKWILRQLQSKSLKMLVSWKIGVGKSYNIDDLIDEALKQDSFGLIIVLAPRISILKERRLLQGYKNEKVGTVLFLRGRTEAKCPTSWEYRWKKLERNGLSLVGRQEICNKCKKRLGCFWLKQYDNERLKQAKVVFATQQQLTNNPEFIKNIVEMTGARSHLVIYDEPDMLLNPRKPKYLKSSAVEQFKLVLQQSINQELFRGKRKKFTIDLIRICELLLDALDPDSEERLTINKIARNAKLPADLDQGWCAAIQRFGNQNYGDNFKFIAYELHSILKKRKLLKPRITGDGEIKYVVPVFYGDSYIIYTGFISSDFISQRIKEFSLVDTFKSFTFGRLDTNFYNIASKMGMAKYFLSNQDTILDFFARLIIIRLSMGLKVLLISKKKFAASSVMRLNLKFKELGHPEIKVSNRKKYTLKQINDSNFVPLITYGSVGVNDFEDYNCVYCLNGFYVSENELWPYLDEYIKNRDGLKLMIVEESLEKILQRKSGIHYGNQEEQDDNDCDSVVIRRKPVLLRIVPSDEITQSIREESRLAKDRSLSSPHSFYDYVDKEEQQWDEKIDDAQSSVELSRLEYDYEYDCDNLFRKRLLKDILQVKNKNNQINNPGDNIDTVQWFQRFALNALEYLETNTVLQAIGRVRPFTKPREVITFQVPVEESRMISPKNTFYNLASAREFFGIETSRKSLANDNARRVQRLKNEGLNPLQIAAKLGLGKSTVYRHLKQKEEPKQVAEHPRSSSGKTFTWSEQGYRMQFLHNFDEDN